MEWTQERMKEWNETSWNDFDMSGQMISKLNWTMNWMNNELTHDFRLETWIDMHWTESKYIEMKWHAYTHFKLKPWMRNFMTFRLNRLNACWICQHVGSMFALSTQGFQAFPAPCRTCRPGVDGCAHFTFWPDGGCLLSGPESVLQAAPMKCLSSNMCGIVCHRMPRALILIATVYWRSKICLHFVFVCTFSFSIRIVSCSICQLK